MDIIQAFSVGSDKSSGGSGRLAHHLYTFKDGKKKKKVYRDKNRTGRQSLRNSVLYTHVSRYIYIKDTIKIVLGL